MAIFNYLSLNIICPRCGVEAEMEAEFRFGLRDLTHYHVGDQLRWDGMGVKTPEARPDEGNYEDEAYVVCPHCERDFWLTVSVRKDIIVGATIDTTKQPYISDEATQQPKQATSATVPNVSPVWKPKPRVRKIGQISNNEKWNLTPKIEDLLQQLIKFGVDIFSTRGGTDYTILVPLDLSHEQQDKVDRLMRMLGKEVKGKVEYVDWYPHGWKFRITPHIESRS